MVVVNHEFDCHANGTQAYVSMERRLQVLVYFAVSKLGEKPIDGKTDVNPEGLTAAYGKHAAAMAERLAAGDLSCKVVFHIDGAAPRAFV